MPETFQYFSKGIICNNYYSGSEWTLPSIATYWTGKHSSHHMNLMEDYRFDFMKDSKVLAEYFHDAGYVTAKIGGNDAVTPWQGYIRGIDRFTYQYSSQAYRTKEVISDVIQQIETLRMPVSISGLTSLICTILPGDLCALFRCSPDCHWQHGILTMTSQRR